MGGSAGGDPLAVRRGSAAALVVAVAAISTAGPIIAACSVPAIAIAFWRCFLAAAPTAAVAGFRRGTVRRAAGPARPGVAADDPATQQPGPHGSEGLEGSAGSDRPRPMQRRALLASGLLLAAHFGAWIPSLSLTSVAASTALVSTVPVWTALMAVAAGARLPARLWVGISAALAGVVLLTGVDASASPAALAGDALALVGGMFAAGYLALGQRLRPRMDNISYTAAVYSVAAAALLAACLAAGAPLAGYSPRDWALLLTLTVLAQLLGHSMLNYSLAQLPATAVAMAVLLEVPGAALIASLWLGQQPPWQAYPAIALILVGLATAVGGGRPVGSPTTGGSAARQ